MTALASGLGRAVSCVLFICTVLVGCGRSATKGDPISAIPGTYVGDGGELRVSTAEMNLVSRRLPFTNGLHPSGEGKLAFSGAVIKSGVIFDDKCSGEITAVVDGVNVMIESGSDNACNAFAGNWKFDTNARLARANAAIVALRFEEAVRELGGLHPRDSAGAERATALSTSPEVKAGLAWEKAGEAEAFDLMTALLKIDGPSAPAGRDWAMRKVKELCKGALPHRPCLQAARLARTGTNGAQLNAALQETARAWLAAGQSKEFSGKPAEALETYDDVCGLDDAMPACDQASARWSGIKLRSAQADMAAGRFASARASLEAVVGGRHVPSRAGAQRLLESPAFRGGSALEGAEAKLREKGPSDEVIEALDAVCAQAATSPSCVKARGRADDLQMQLATADVAGGRFVSAHRRLGAVVRAGGVSAAKAKAMLAQPDLRDGVVVEAARGRVEAAIARCKEARSSCKALAAEAVSAMGTDGLVTLRPDLAQRHLADLNDALRTYRRLVQEGAAATAKVDALVEGCNTVNEAERMAAVCFPPAVPTTSGQPVAPTLLERAGLTIAATLLGPGISSSRATLGIAVAFAWLGAMIALVVTAAQRGRALGGLGVALALSAMWGLAIVARGSVRGVDQAFIAVGIAPYDGATLEPLAAARSKVDPSPSASFNESDPDLSLPVASASSILAPGPAATRALAPPPLARPALPPAASAP